MHAILLWCYDALSEIFMIGLICLFSLIFLVCILFALCLAFLAYTSRDDPPIKETNPKPRGRSAFIKRMYRG
jgi:hypothetical protein